MVSVRQLSTFIILLICSCNAIAQFSVEAFLATSREDLSLDPIQSKIDFLKENNFNGPWVSRVEFRTRSNDANISQEDFRFRITPGNPGELKANKRYYGKQVALLDIEYREQLNKALLRRYSIAIEHIFEARKRNSLEQQLGINKQLINMMNGSAGAYDMDVGDLVDAESNEMELKLSIEDSKIEIEEMEYVIREFYEYEGQLDWNQVELIQVSDILNLFSEFKDRTSGEHINLVKMEQKSELAAERFSIEKSESLRNIGYFQAEYDTERGKEAYDHFGYQIGIRIPIVNPDKPQLNRRKLALMDDQALIEEKKDDLRKQLELSVLRMEHYTTQHSEINTKLESVSQQNYLALRSPGKMIKISDMIKMNEFYADLVEKRNTVQKKIYQTYLEYLNLSGLLSEVPIRNYLSKNLTEF